MTILQLDATTPMDNLAVGGKSAGLIRLVRLGIPVPKAIILTAAYYSAQARRCGLIEKIRPSLEKSDWMRVEKIARKTFFSEPLNDELSEFLLCSYRKMNAPAVAVRSSATCEDQKEASAAGQYDTFLNIGNGKDLLHAVRQCWASLWNHRALIYRHRLGIDHFSVEMAVIIQEMVPADVSGVLFTVDPLAHDQSKMRLEVITGLGDALVSGTRDSKTLLVDRKAQGKTMPTLPGLLDREQVAELYSMGLSIENALNGAQDIEFCLANRKIFLLQTRPMTALTRPTVEAIEPLGKPSFLDKMIKPFADERYVVAPQPLDNIVVRLLIGGHLYAIKECGAKVKAEDEDAVKSQIWRQAYRMPPIHHLWMMFFQSMPLLYRQLNTDWLTWWNTGPEIELRAVSESENLALLQDQELFSRADSILSTWERHLNIRMSAAGGIRWEFLLKSIVFLAVGPKKHRQVLADLMAGIQTPTVTMNEDLWQLSCLARQDSTVLACVQRMEPDRLQESEEGRRFAESFDKFIEKYGHREGACWYLTTPTWRHDRDQVWRILASLAGSDVRTGKLTHARIRRMSAFALVEKRLHVIPCLPKVFRWLRFHLYRMNVFREKSHYDLTRPLDTLQNFAKEWARRLLDRGVLEHESDIGFLTYNEVRKWLCESPPAPADAKRLIATRRATYQLVNTAWQSEREGKPCSGKKLKGVAASPGTVRGKVRMIHSEHEFDRLRKGEVLVSPYTNPAWTPLFSVAAAVITETGGAASHAAIVAREYGIPAVMAIPGATQILIDGQDVLVDGGKGLVFQ